MQILEDVTKFAHERRLGQSWLSLLSSYQDTTEAAQRVSALSASISTADRLNVFSQSREEAEEKDWKERLSHRQEETRHFAVEVMGLLKELSERVPGFSVTMVLEGYLRRVDSLSTAEDAVKLSQQIEAWVSELARHETVSDSDTQPPSPGGPFPRLAMSCLELAAALSLARNSSERRWGDAVPVLSPRHLLLRLVHRCRAAAGQDLPGIPLPCALLKHLRGLEEPVEAEDPILGSLSKAELDARFRELENLCGTLARVRLGLRTIKGRISVMDRVNVFTDTQDEATEKAWKVELKGLTSSFHDLCHRLLKDTLALRARAWPTFLLDHGSSLAAMVRRISVTDPQGFINRTAEVTQREPAAMAVGAFRNALLSSYAGAPRLEVLRAGVEHEPVNLAAEVVPISHCPMPEAPDTARILSLLARELRGDYQRAKQAVEEARHRVRDTETEIAGKTGFEAAREMFSSLLGGGSAGAAERSLQDKQRELDEALVWAVWRVYAPSALSYLLDQLGDEIASIRAEVHSRTVRSNDSTRTEYYSVLIGEEKACHTGEFLQQLIQDTAREALFPCQWLEQYCDNATSRELRAQPLAF